MHTLFGWVMGVKQICVLLYDLNFENRIVQYFRYTSFLNCIGTVYVIIIIMYHCKYVHDTRV